MEKSMSNREPSRWGVHSDRRLKSEIQTLAGRKQRSRWSIHSDARLKTDIKPL